MSSGPQVVREDQPNDSLLVEGKNDLHVMCSLFEHHRVPETFAVKDKGGLDNILATLDVELDVSGRERLGIVVDADINLALRWESLRSRLIALGYVAMPVLPDMGGTIVSLSGRPTVGVWVMPDNALPGMLEDFVSMLVPPDDPLWPVACQAVDEAMANGCRCPNNHRTKAQIHTWLAWQEEPGAPLGQAITKRYLDADATIAHKLIDWIRRLFHS